MGSVYFANGTLANSKQWRLACVSPQSCIIVDDVIGQLVVQFTKTYSVLNNIYYAMGSCSHVNVQPCKYEHVCQQSFLIIQRCNEVVFPVLIIYSVLIMGSVY